MNDRLATLAAAGLALLLLAWLFGLGPPPEPPPASRPTSRDAGDAGLLGLYRWLERGDVPVRSLRGRYTTLAAQAGPRGNLLIIAEPMVWPVRPSERDALHDWVRQGNHVLLLRDSGNLHWRRGPGGAIEALGLRLRRLQFREPGGEERADDWEPDATTREHQAACSAPSITRGTIAGEQRRLRPVPGSRHPVLAGIGELQVRVPFPAGVMHDVIGYGTGGRYWYPLLCDPQRRLPALTVFRAGDGRVWALDYGEAFGNDNLDRADNARLFGNLLALTLAPGGAVIFDDMHQGDSALYDPAAFFADRRLHGTLAFLLAAWLVWLLGYDGRFAAAAPADAGASLRDFARSTGRFYARYLARGEAARGPFRHFFNDVRLRLRLPPTGAPVWEILGRAPARAQPQLAELRALHDQLERGRRVNLPRLRNLLLTVRKELT